MKTLIALLFLLGLLLVAGCSESENKPLTGAAVSEVPKAVAAETQAQVQQNATDLVSKVEEQEDTLGETVNNISENISEVKQPAIEEKTALKSQYTITELEKDINDIMGTTYTFKEDSEDPSYIKSSDLKYYVIKTSKNENEYINSANDFCTRYCADNWDGWRYYVNMTEWNWLHPPLVEKNFSSRSLYVDYVSGAYFINHSIIEKSYDVSNGKIIEYQFIAWMEDSGGYFEGSWEGAYLIYKIYCTPNLTVFISPKSQQIQIGISSQQMPAVFKNWENQLEFIRQDMLEKANKILGKCGVSKKFFEQTNFPDHFESEKLAIYWKTDFGFYFNMTSSVNPEIIPPQAGNGKHTLKSVNVLFTNHDFEIWSPLSFKITTAVDGGDETEYYSGRIATTFRVGETLNRDIAKDTVQFAKNLTIKATLYLEEGNVEAKPAIFTILN